ncbi:alpha/beta hydrolase [Pseudohalioglobus sediminis]|uniref:Alpha/beta hydrolase n=1 Tax=Pseudohalioglobus sediminis TaxID=2606449 RepID=A0A5B0WRE8_9GAMM|nr:alpha/beta hydrolase [Pseudohalioglobus sediminis]KAA1188895.1 alpha/beta hydrolase [Pseudohalioglobus sediminis]
MSRSAFHSALRAGVILMTGFLAACTDLGLRAVSAPSELLGDMRVESDIPYGNKAHQGLDLYFPAAAAGATAPQRLVIFVYGGDWTSGNKDGYAFVADALTAAGYTVAIPDYAKYPDVTFPDFVADVALAVSWLAGNGGRFEHVDEIVLMGHSAGAHTGALLVTDPRFLGAHQFPLQRIDAFVGLAGPYAYLPQNQKYRDIFGNLEDYQQMQPLHFLSGSEPPMLLLHGEDDSTVLPLHTQKFADKATALGVDVSVHIYPGRGHANLVLALSRLQSENNAVREDILSFLER